MNYISPPTLFGAAIELLPHVAGRPLGQLDEVEERAAASSAVRIAKLVAKELSQGSWAPTVEPLPRYTPETPEKGDARKPEWIRLPTKGKCPHSGLSRSALYVLVSTCAANDYKPPVKSIVLRRRGAQRGMRLVSYDSLMDYLERESRNQSGS